ncbi:MAG: hypothetical protein ACI9MC_003630, partial [Kiritimatiellia bacterium]
KIIASVPRAMCPPAAGCPTGEWSSTARVVHKLFIVDSKLFM